MGTWSTTAPSLPAGSTWSAESAGSTFAGSNYKTRGLVSIARGSGSTVYVRVVLQAQNIRYPDYQNAGKANLYAAVNEGGGFVLSSKYEKYIDVYGAWKPVKTVYYECTAVEGDTIGYRTYWSSGSYGATKTLTAPALITYAVTYNGNGSDGGSTAAQEKIDGVDLTLASNGFTRTGYNFVRWNTAPDGSGTDYAAGSAYTANAALTLYAVWEAAASQILTVNSSVQTQGNINLQMDRKNPAYWHKATYSLNGTTLLTSAAFETSLTTAVPRSWFANTPNSATISVTLSVTTYTDSTCTETMGNPVTTTITVTADDGMKPTITSGWAVAAAYNAGAVSGFTGYIKGYSKAEITFDATKITHATGAALGSYSVTYKGVTVSASPYRTEILTETSVSVVCTVTDSRGRTASETLTLTVADYSEPTITRTEICHCQSDGTQDDGGYYLKVKARLTCTGLSGQNTVSGTVAVAPKGGSYGSPTALASDTALVIGTYNPDASWMVKITATDTVGNTVTYEETIPQQAWAMKFRANGSGVGFGVAPSGDNVFEVKGTWAVKGMGFIDLIYPVGSVYISTDSTADPETLFGGTWTAVTLQNFYAWERTS